MRVSKQDLENIVDRLNSATDSPMNYFKGMSNNINIGHYTLSGAYGGWQLQRIINDGGGVTQPIGGGFISKRELYKNIECYLIGIQQYKN